MFPTSESAGFRFNTQADADAFRKTIFDAGLRHARPICWHDKNKAFPKVVTGASCFFLRFADGCIGITAAHVVRGFQKARAATSSLVCQLHVMPFDLTAALVDIDDDIDIATFAISDHDLKTTQSDPFDVSWSWPLTEVVRRHAPIQVVGYPENVRMIDPTDRSAVFQAWGALDFVEDFTKNEIIVVYDPKKVIGSPTLPPLGYNMSGCSGGPAIIHGTRAGLHRWYPVGLVIAGTKTSEGASSEFDMIRIRRIDCVEPTGRIRRPGDVGWLPGQ